MQGCSSIAHYYYISRTTDVQLGSLLVWILVCGTQTKNGATAQPVQ